MLGFLINADRGLSHMTEHVAFIINLTYKQLKETKWKGIYDVFLLC